MKKFEDTLTDAQLMLISKAQKSGPDALSDGELQELSSLKKRHQVYQEPEMTNTQAAKLLGKGALNLAGRALDLPGGIVRVGAGTIADAVTDNNIVTKDDYLQALLGNAPTTATMLERGGAGEMGSVDLPLVGKVTGRGTLGFAGDVASGLGASSALRIAAKGPGLLAKAATAVRAPEALLEKGMNSAGKAIYRSGLKAVDQAAMAANKGKNAVSDILMKRGIWGSAGSVADEAGDLVRSLDNQVDEVVNKAASSGKSLDLEKVFQPTRQKALAIINDTNLPSVKAEAQGMLSELDDLIAQQKPGSGTLVDKVQRVKKQFYKKAKDVNYKLGARPEEGKQLLKSAGHDAMDALEQIIPDVAPLNKEMAPILSAEKVFAKHANKEANKNLFSSVDGMITGAGNLPMLALKKTADFAKMTMPRTGGGLLLQNPTMQALSAQGLIEAMPGSERGNQDPLIENIERIKRKYGIKD